MNARRFDATRGPRPRHLALFVTALVAVAACGTDDAEGDGQATPDIGGDQTRAEPVVTEGPDSDEAPTTTAGSEPASSEAEPESVQASGDPVRFISVIGVTGPSSTPEAAEGIEAAVAAINADGGIQGRPMEIEICDVKGDPNEAEACGRQAASGDYVGVVGSITPFGDLYIPPVAEAGIPIVGNFVLGSADLTSPVSYPITGGAPTIVSGVAQVLAENGGTRVHTTFLDFGSAPLLATFAEESLAGYPDVTLTGQTGIPPDAADITPFAQSSLGDRADAIVFTGGPDLLNQFLLTLNQLGAAPLLATSSSGLTAETIDIVGDSTEGFFVVGHIFPPTFTENEGIVRFNTEMDDVGANGQRGEVAQNSWAAAHITAMLLQDAPLDTAGLQAAIDGSGEIQFGPVTPFDWSKPNEAFAPFRVFTNDVIFSKVDGGVVTPIDGDFSSLGGR